MMTHGTEQGHRIEHEDWDHGASVDFSICEKFCQRHGWSTVSGVTGELRWMAEHHDCQ